MTWLLHFSPKSATMLPHAEPRLQPLSGEYLSHRTAQPCITTDNARLDTRAIGFWFAACSRRIFWCKGFQPECMHPTTCPEPSKLPKKHENENKHAYGQRVRDIEQGVSPPRLLNHRWTGAKGQKNYSRYARLDIRKKLFSIVISWLRCKLSFAAVRSSIMYIDIYPWNKIKINMDPYVYVMLTSLLLQDPSHLINWHYKLLSINHYVYTYTCFFLLYYYSWFYTSISV